MEFLCTAFELYVYRIDWLARRKVFHFLPKIILQSSSDSWVFHSNGICTLLRNKVNRFSRMFTNVRAYFNVTQAVKAIRVALRFYD